MVASKCILNACNRFCHFPRILMQSFKYKLESVCYTSQQIAFRNVYSRNTIFALSTPSGLSAIAVIRISGPNASDVFYSMMKKPELPVPRKAILCKVKDPQTDELLDTSLALWFPSPKSFTGEDMCELHIHGGVAVVKSILKALQKLQNYRYAEAGEFTKRAFLAGKLDLTEVEGLADLLNAETEAQQKLALRQMEGSLYKMYSDWTNRIKRCLARLEAYIDFSEDQLLDSTILDSVKKELLVLQREISAQLKDKRRGEKLRNGVFTVLIGRPNVGKSSLLNCLCQRDVAIVSPIAGTTRDIVETSLNLDGYLVHVSDTAGIRETSDSIELEGVRRAKERSSQADILLFIMEAEQLLKTAEIFANQNVDPLQFLLSKEFGNKFHDFLNNQKHSNTEAKSVFDNVILLLNKIDLLPEFNKQNVYSFEKLNSSICVISCTEGTGMERFLKVFSNKVKEICSGHRGEEPIITHERHRHCLEECLRNVSEYEECLNYDAAIAADKLRTAVNELGKITGQVRTDDILDIVFKDFCIGK